MKHYGSTAVKYTGRQIITFAICSCGWKSEEEVCEIDEGYDLRDMVKILGALTEIELNHHLRSIKSESLND